MSHQYYVQAPQVPASGVHLNGYYQNPAGSTQLMQHQQYQNQQLHQMQYKYNYNMYNQPTYAYGAIPAANTQYPMQHYQPLVQNVFPTQHSLAYQNIKPFTHAPTAYSNPPHHYLPIQQHMQQPMQQHIQQHLQQHIQQPMPQHIPQPRPQHIQQAMPQHIPQPRPQHIQQAMPQHIQQAIPQHMPQHIPQPVPQPIPQPRPQPIPQPIPQPATNYLSQLQSAVQHYGAFQARPTAPTTSMEVITQNKSNPQGMVIPEKSALDLSSVAGYNPTIAQDPSLGQQHALGGSYAQGPGQGQEYITRIRSLVEGSPSAEETSISSTVAEQPAPFKRKKIMASTTDSPITKIEKKPIPRLKPKLNVPPPDETCEIKNMRREWFPKRLSPSCPYLFIGRNGTVVPESVYETIPWSSFEESTRILLECAFEESCLATRKLYGENCLDPNIISDIVGHISFKCLIKDEHVRTAINSILAQYTVKKFKPLCK